MSSDTEQVNNPDKDETKQKEVVRSVTSLMEEYGMPTSYQLDDGSSFSMDQDVAGSLSVGSTVIVSEGRPRQPMNQGGIEEAHKKIKEELKKMAHEAKEKAKEEDEAAEQERKDAFNDGTVD